MTTVVLYILGAYVAVCWVWGLYLVIRLYTGRRVWQLVRGRGIRPRMARATHQDTGTPRTKGAPEIASATVAKAAAAAAKSRAA